MNRRKKYKILFAATTLVDRNHHVDFANEYDDIQEKLRGAKYRDSFVFKPIFRLNPDNLYLALKEERPSIVHFSCPGEGERGLKLGDVMMTGKELRDFFQSFSDDIKLVVLNACYSKAQAVYIKKAIDCVVGMDSSIKDESSKKFSSFFYYTLANGGSVGEAWKSGCISIGINALDDERVPIIMTKEGVDAHKVFFVSDPTESQEITHISNLIKEPDVDASNRIDVVCPYPGMVQFKPENAEFFFGREKETEKIIWHFRHHRFLLCIGPSGSGKSSFIKAGLIPGLSQSHIYENTNWLIKYMRPGEHPLHKLEKVLGGSLDDLSQMIKSLLSKTKGKNKLFIVIDQFEELFALCTDKSEQTACINVLKALMDNQNCAVLVSMRADFYSDLMNSQLWPVYPIQRMDIAPIRGDRLREAITKPAAALSVKVEPGLVERLLSDAKDEPGALPFLQETMVLLWSKREKNRISLKMYEELGDDERSGLAVSIAYKADAAFSQLTDIQRQIARKVFLRLIQFGKGLPDTRRQQTMDDLRAGDEHATVFDWTIQHLTSNRLLTLGSDSKGQVKLVEISHESLINGWPTLRKWIDEQSEAEKTRRRLEAKAQNWKRLGQRKGGLLDQVELTEGERWLASSQAQILGVSQLLSRLVLVSRKNIDKRRFRDKKILIFQSIGIIVLLVLSLLVLNNWQAAENSRVLAQNRQNEMRSRELAGASREAANTDHTLSLLLAKKAVEVLPTFEAVSALHEAVYRPVESVILRGHESAVTHALFSPDGQFVLTTSQDRTAKLWSIAGKELVVFRGHEDIVGNAVFSPDGQFIVTASTDKTARLWTIAGQELVIFRGHEDAVGSAVFSPDGQFILTASTDKTARLWNIEGKELVALKGHKDIVWSAVSSPDGRTVLTASKDLTARLWTKEGRELTVFRGHKDMVWGAVFSPDGKIVLTVSSDKTGRLWTTGGKQLAVLRGHEGVVGRPVFSSDGQNILTASSDSTVRLWTRQGKQLAVYKGHENVVVSAVFSPDNQTILSASADKTARLWTREGKQLAVLRGHEKWLIGATFDPVGKTILTVSAGKTAKLWKEDYGGLMVLKGHQKPVRSAVFSSDGQSILTASVDKTARLWNKDGREIAVCRGHQDMVWSAQFSPDDRNVLTSSFDKTARLWTREGKEITVFRGHQDVIMSAVFSPDNRIILTASNDKTARLWTKAGHALTVIKGHTKGVVSAVFSPEGRGILTASIDKTARLWTREGGALSVMKGHKGFLYSAEFSPDGQTILTASSDKTARLWSREGKELAVFRGHRGDVFRAEFSPDGRIILTVSEDKTIRLWTREGNPITSLGVYGDTAYSAVFSPDGRYILTASSDGTARLFYVRLEDLLQHSKKRVVRDFEPEEKVRYRIED